MQVNGFEDEVDSCALDNVINASYRNREVVSIGSRTCRAILHSSAIINEKGEYSELIVIWFQDGLAMPIDPIVVEQIKAINWDILAEDRSM